MQFRGIRSYCLFRNLYRVAQWDVDRQSVKYVEIKCQLAATEVFIAGCWSILQTGHITLSSTPDQQLENHSTKYHRQQPLYDTLELLMMGIVVSETC